jgi:hypothetical protein
VRVDPSREKKGLPRLIGGQESISGTETRAQLVPKLGRPALGTNGLLQTQLTHRLLDPLLVAATLVASGLGTGIARRAAEAQDGIAVCERPGASRR